MAARNPPLYLQAGSHPATNDRLLFEALMAPPPSVVSGAGYGIVAPGDMAVTQNGTPNMSVNVAAGKAFVDGTENANQGAYLCVNDATVNLAIAASDPTNPRKDLVVAKVQDAEWSGATNAWSLAVVTGTPAASPVEPAVPANAIVLAMVSVAAGATSITNANITDRRRRASALGGVVVCTSATRPASPYIGQVIWETDTSRPVLWDGSAWQHLSMKADPPFCRLRRNANQSLSNGVGAAISWDTTANDTDNMFSGGTPTRLTFKTAGVFAINFGAQFASNGTGHRIAYALLNGVVLVGTQGAVPGDATDGPALLGAFTRKFAVNDYIEIFAVQTSGGNLNVGDGASGHERTFVSALWTGRG